MSEHLVRSTLHQYSDESVPPSDDPWSAIRDRITRSQTTRQSVALTKLNPVGKPSWQPRRVRVAVPWRFAAIGLAAVVLVALGFSLLAAKPTPVSAAQIWAQAEQVAKNGAAATLNSAYMVTEYKRSFMGTDGTVEGRVETWYKAPSRVLSRAVQQLPGGVEQRSFSLEDEAARYYTVPGWDIVFLVATGGDFPRTFSPINLEQTLKLGTNFGSREDAYSITLVGTEEVAGRQTYVLERSLRPEALGEDSGVLIHRSRLWIDREFFVALRIRAWDASGKLVDETDCVSLELNGAVDPALFKFEPPEGMYVADMRPAQPAEVSASWQNVMQSESVTLYSPLGLPGSMFQMGMPYAQGGGVVAQAIVRTSGNGAAPMLHALVVQGPVSSISAKGADEASPQQLDSAHTVARVYEHGGLIRLLLDKGQDDKVTRILLLSTNARSQDDLRQIARSLRPVGGD